MRRKISISVSTQAEMQQRRGRHTKGWARPHHPCSAAASIKKPTRDYPNTSATSALNSLSVPKPQNLTTILSSLNLYQHYPNTSAASALNSLSVSKPRNADSPEMQVTNSNVLVIVLWGDSNVFGFPCRHPLPELPARGFLWVFSVNAKQNKQ